MNMDNVYKAQAIVDMNLLKVLSRNMTDGKIRSVLIPGSQGKQYQVILRRNPTGITAECLLQAGERGHVGLCPSGKYMCYHAIAAVMLSLIDQGLSFRMFKRDNVRLFYQRFGTTVYTVQKHSNYAVVPINLVLAKVK